MLEVIFTQNKAKIPFGVKVFPKKHFFDLLCETRNLSIAIQAPDDEHFQAGFHILRYLQFYSAERQSW